MYICYEYIHFSHLCIFAMNIYILSSMHICHECIRFWYPCIFVMSVYISSIHACLSWVYTFLASMYICHECEHFSHPCIFAMSVYISCIHTYLSWVYAFLIAVSINGSLSFWIILQTIFQLTYWQWYVHPAVIKPCVGGTQSNTGLICFWNTHVEFDNCRSGNILLVFKTNASRWPVQFSFLQLLTVTSVL